MWEMPRYKDILKENYTQYRWARDDHWGSGTQGAPTWWLIIYTRQITLCIPDWVVSEPLDGNTWPALGGAGVEVDFGGGDWNILSARSSFKISSSCVWSSMLNLLFCDVRPVQKAKSKAELVQYAPDPKLFKKPCAISRAACSILEIPNFSIWQILTTLETKL